MEQELTQIINLLTSNELPTTLTGLKQTHKLLMSLLPSIKQYQNLLMNTNNSALMYNQRHIKAKSRFTTIDTISNFTR